MDRELKKVDMDLGLRIKCCNDLFQMQHNQSIQKLEDLKDNQNANLQLESLRIRDLIEDIKKDVKVQEDEMLQKLKVLEEMDLNLKNKIIFVEMETENKLTGFQENVTEQLRDNEMKSLSYITTQFANLNPNSTPL